MNTKILLSLIAKHLKVYLINLPQPVSPLPPNSQEILQADIAGCVLTVSPGEHYAFSSQASKL